jgi:hypothetical protein
MRHPSFARVGADSLDLSDAGHAPLVTRNPKTSAAKLTDLKARM